MARKVLALGRILVSVAVLLAIGVGAVSLVLKLAHGQDAGRPAGDGVGVALTPDAVAAEVHRLRVDAHDPNSARALAKTFLAGYATPDVWRQLVEFENAMTYRDDGDAAGGVPLFQEIVTTYTTADFATAMGALADPNVVVDDAQYYVAALQEPAGDVAAVTSAYEALLTQFPGSNRTAQATLRLGNFLAAHGDTDGALEWLGQVVTNFPDTPLAPEAQVNIAGVYRSAQQFDLAAEAFERVLARWPASVKCGFVLQNLNRMLMEQDGTAWAAGQLPSAGAPGHFAVIESNVNLLLKQYPQVAEAPGTLLDAVNYCDALAWWQGGLGLEMRAQIADWADRLVTLYPDTTEGWAARGSLSTAISYTDPNRAQAILEEIRTHATATGNAGDRASALFSKAMFMQNAGDLAAARALWTEALQGPLHPVMEGEAKMLLASAMAGTGDPAAALDLLDSVVADGAYPDSVHATALVHKAGLLRQLHRRREALDVLRTATEQYPNVGSGVTARMMLAN